MDGFEVGRHGGNRIGVAAEPNELRMMAIAFGLAAEDLLREERFTPQGNKTLGVEIFGMQCPDAHERRKPNFTGVREPE